MIPGSFVDSVPSPAVAEASSDFVHVNLVDVNLQVSSLGSGGGPPALPSRPAPAKQGSTTPPTSPFRGGAASYEGKLLSSCTVEVQTTEPYVVFSAQTCSELLHLLTPEQLNFELEHFKSLGCNTNIAKTRGAKSSSNIKKELTGILSKVSCDQYKTSLNNYDSMINNLFHLTSRAEEQIRKLLSLESSPSATAPLCPDTTAAISSTPPAPEVKFNDQVFNFLDTINFEELSVDGVTGDIDISEPASCGRKVNFRGNTTYTYGSINHTPEQYSNCSTFNTIFDKLQSIDFNVTRENYTCLTTYYRDGKVLIPEHHDDEYEIVPGRKNLHHFCRGYSYPQHRGGRVSKCYMLSQRITKILP